jgi:uncharacterized Zn finger protein
MTWTFPATERVKCDKCAKEFDITFTDRNSTRYSCPDCGTVYHFDFEVAEKKALQSAEEIIRAKFKEGGLI